jgi:hypothetical protein
MSSRLCQCPLSPIVDPQAEFEHTALDNRFERPRLRPVDDEASPIAFIGISRIEITPPTEYPNRISGKRPMPLYIKDNATTDLVARLARLRGLSKQDAIKLAVQA